MNKYIIYFESKKMITEGQAQNILEFMSKYGTTGFLTKLELGRGK